VEQKKIWERYFNFLNFIVVAVVFCASTPCCMRSVHASVANTCAAIYILSTPLTTSAIYYTARCTVSRSRARHFEFSVETPWTGALVKWTQYAVYLHSALHAYYLRQGGYVIVVVCLFVCRLATLRKIFRTDLHEIFTKDWQWATEQMTIFCR